MKAEDWLEFLRYAWLAGFAIKGLGVVAGWWVLEEVAKRVGW